MHRRDLLKAMIAAGLLPMATGFGRRALAETTRYEGPIHFTVFAEGGWDVTSLCDPKGGTRVDPNTGNTVWINHWAEQGGSVQTTASGLDYAPFADNARLFDTLGERMMVINGIDAQTNAHSAGVRHTFSGRFADGYPAVTALAATQHGQGLPLAFLSNGGYRETAGLTQFTLMQDPNALRDLIDPNRFHPTWIDTQFHRTDSLALIEQARQARLDRLQARTALTRRLTQAAHFLESSRAGRDQLAALNEFMPDELAPVTDADGNWHPLLRQIQLALVSAAAGLTVSADLVQWGFDTHATHDTDQGRALTQLSDGLIYLWEEAARMDQQYGTNLVGRLRLVVASDFGRTPWYNDGEGKDHWPLGSAILMRDGGFATNTVGGTTGSFESLGVNSDLSLNPDPNDSSASIILPAHLQQLLRYWAGAEEVGSDFPLETGTLDLRSLV
ncbi:DUF1501 domain-containing protein [Saccharospirillum impatiens]|uniref:DUF1501 domain-containing protein n=1 Tax=Saccharospirillum impatiens TaxID=169438 RepID=UPI000401A7B2|nr:DUF1501 domain-containing protein [Saccharospirillum impatiens]